MGESEMTSSKLVPSAIVSIQQYGQLCPGAQGHPHMPFNALVWL